MHIMQEVSFSLETIIAGRERGRERERERERERGEHTVHIMSSDTSRATCKLALHTYGMTHKMM